MEFEGKRALITGASRGLGLEIAIALSKKGAKVYAVGRNTQALAGLKAQHPSITTIECDLTNQEATTKALGPLTFDLLVNCAGARAREAFLDVKPESFDLVFGTNLKSVFFISQLVAKNMIKGSVKGGAIVNISSIASSRTFPCASVYSSSKAALDMLTKAMAFELGQAANIRVNSINPCGIMSNEMEAKLKMADAESKVIFEDSRKRTPLEGSCGGGPIVSAEEVVDTTLFLLSDKAKAITGQLIFVDNGYLTS